MILTAQGTNVRLRYFSHFYRKKYLQLNRYVTFLRVKYTGKEIIIARQQSCEKVMFSVLFVCHYVCP